MANKHFKSNYSHINDEKYKIHSECEFICKFPRNNPNKLPKQVSNIAIMSFGDDLGKQVLLMK